MLNNGALKWSGIADPDQSPAGGLGIGLAVPLLLVLVVCVATVALLLFCAAGSGHVCPFAAECKRGLLGFAALLIVYLVFRINQQEKYAARAQRQLAESRDVLQMVLSSISDIIFNLDPDGRVIKLFNPSDAGSLVAVPDDFIGRHFSEVFPPELCQKLTQGIEAVAQGKAVTEFDYSMSGTPYQSWFLAKVSPLCTSEGTLLGYTVVSRNITRRKLSELKQSKLEQELQRSEQSAMMGRIAAGIAHEINNPASAVQSDIQTLQALASRLDGNETVGKMMAILQRDAQAIARVTMIVAAVKGAYRPDKWHLIDIEEEIELQLTLLRSRKGVVPHIERVYGHPKRVEVCGSEIGQILLNLLANAADALDEGGVITITTQELNENMARVRVRDNGCGIDLLAQAHLFEPFFTTKPIGHGTGLGLSISAHLAQHHGARLYLESSAPGSGSEFVLEIPLRRQNVAL